MGGVASLLMPYAVLESSMRVTQLFEILWKYNECVELDNSVIDNFITDTTNTTDVVQLWESHLDLHTLEINDHNCSEYVNELRMGIQTLLNMYENIENSDKNVFGYANAVCKLQFDRKNIDSCLLYFANTTNQLFCLEQLELMKKKSETYLKNMLDQSNETNLEDKFDQLFDNEFVTIQNKLINMGASFVCIINGYLNKQISCDMMQHCVDKLNMPIAQSNKAK